jgi:DNA-binding CsgD family transcriptional regulator
MSTLAAESIGPVRPMLPFSSWAGLISALEASPLIERPDQLRAWVHDHLAGVLPHRHFCCILGTMHQGGLRPRLVIGDRPVDEYVERHRLASGEFQTPALLLWRAVGSVVTEADLSEDARAHLAGDAIERLVAFGILDRAGGLSSYCELIGLRHCPPLEAAYVAQLVSASVHGALVRAAGSGSPADARAPTGGGAPVGRASAVVGRAPPARPAPLTPREKEVLRWISEGKSVWETARILGRSEHTIKNQVRRVYSKLGIHTRVQAVRIADRLLQDDRAAS